MIDIDSIPFGADFRRKIGRAVGDSDVLIAVIGDRWLRVTDESGRLRLQDEDDYVRNEIEAAFDHGIPVFPVLIDDSPMPKSEELPASLARLPAHNAVRVRADQNFNANVDRLIRDLVRVVAVRKPDRRRWPSAKFLGYWLRFLFRRWPLPFAQKWMFLAGGALLYAGVILLTLLWRGAALPETARWTLALTGGAGAALLWWLMTTLAVAANEDGWHSGGYVAGTVHFLWPCGLFVWFWMLCRAHPAVVAGQPNLVALLGIDLFLIMWAVLIFGCNAGHAIIALAETVRNDEREDLPQALGAFDEFRSRFWQVNLANLIAMVSARPVVYFGVMFVFFGLVGSHVAYSLVSGSGEPGLGLILLRDAFLLVFIAWQVFWYFAAFQLIQREVDRRRA